MNASSPDSVPRGSRGRGAASNLPNRFEPVTFLPDPEEESCAGTVPTHFYRDASCSVITTNKSPDIGFNKSLNPYRGCEHGCVYCYARPTHEYLGFSAGLDFETKIMVKEDAPRLLEAALSSSRWKPEVLVLSGVTDPYQPIEKKLKITRRCLEILAGYRNPVFMITKNFLVTRDSDLLSNLARYNAAAVMLSITTLNPDLARTMEPRTASPRQRLEAIAQLTAAGIPVGVNIAPVIPGLNDEEIPAIIAAAQKVGASFAGYTPLRLPYGVKAIFIEWLERCFPSKKKKILDRIRSLRGGKLNDSRWGSRMRGGGLWAEQFEHLFKLGCRRAGFKNQKPALSTAHFKNTGYKQLTLFDLDSQDQ